MNKYNLCYHLFSLTLLFFLGTSVAADSDQTSDTANYVQPKPQAERIEALRQQLLKRGLGQQIQTLEASDESFLALYQAAVSRDTIGCVILLPADNEHPDWPHTIAPLRNGLPEYGWCTLSIELPDIIKRAQAVSSDSDNSAPAETTGLVLKEQATIFARIQASIDFAKQNNAQSIVLVGDKTGASYALNFLAQTANAANALVMIDIETPAGSSDYELAQQLKSISVPVLDFYSPIRSKNFALWRKQASNQNPQAAPYQAIESSLADIDDTNQQQLVQRVRGFLKQNTAQIEQRKSLPQVTKGLFY